MIKTADIAVLVIFCFRGKNKEVSFWTTVIFKSCNICGMLKQANYDLLIIENLRMYRTMYDEKKIINLRDSVRGVVTGQNKGGGLYIDMKIEDEDANKGIVTIPAFGYWCGRVSRGTWVLCTIKSTNH